MLLSSDEDEEKASRLAAGRGLALVALGIGISLDELAIGATTARSAVSSAMTPPVF
jgi:putative Mn2+ efflux pump MntP